MTSEAVSLKATLGGGAALFGPTTGTLIGTGPTPPAPVDLDATVIGEPLSTPATLGPQSLGSTVRTTVLPRRAHVAAPESAAARARFERVRTLGEGAMGEVELVRDNDIRRTVAVKRLRGEANTADALLRFADEVRIVGQLEHPSIVPIYDVGRDEANRIYLVMKHLDGRTMEDVIEALRQGDAETRRQFTLAQRVHVFLGVLDAIRYAHARGIVHRDIKPANLMIGPFGEVTVLDWGIAKPIARRDTETAVEPLDRTALESADARLLETRLGSLAGTPLYMSPEQAAGRNDAIDERSDVYALCVVLYEWLVLTHPLAGERTVTEVLARIIARDYSAADLRDPAIASGVPMEYVQIIARGLQRDPARRFQSTSELEDALKAVLAGKVRIACHVTLAKRTLYGTMAWIDDHVQAYSLMFVGTLLTLLGLLAYGAFRLLAG